jgi:hypothetical protein
VATLRVGAATLDVAVTAGAPPQVGWDQLFNAVPLNEPAITDWYRANTGHRFAPTLNMAGQQLSITDAWLNANLAGPNVSREGDRWVVERVLCRNVRTYVDDVTHRDIFVDTRANGANVRGIVALEGQRNLIYEHCTLQGGLTVTTGSDGIAQYFPQATEPNQIQLRNMDISGYRAGLYMIGGDTAEYCWVHDLYFSDGSHNTGGSIRSRNCTIRRCLITDGNSAAVNLYAEYTPYTGVLIQENVLRLRESDTGPELGIYKEFEVARPGETRRVLGNRFYRGNIGNRNGGGFTEWAGNRRFNGTSVP